MNAVKGLQENPELGAYRIHTALLQMGIKLSPRTCGRILALNRKLYHLQMPVKHGRPKKEMPFKAIRRHHYWTTDIRYLDMHQLGGGMIYCISILENFSRAILASAISRRQDTEAYLAVLYAAIRKYGDRKSTRLNSSHQIISYAVFCLKKKKRIAFHTTTQTSTARLPHLRRSLPPSTSAAHRRPKSTPTMSTPGCPSRQATDLETTLP